MPPKIRKADENVMEQFGFSAEPPPPHEPTRRSKYDEMWEAARKVTMQYPGQTFKIVEFNSVSNAYNTAKSINNGEHRAFKGDHTDFTAVGRLIDKETGKSGVWLTYTPKESSD